MNNKYQKYVNALFLAAAALVWFISRHYVEVLIGYLQLGRKLGDSADILQHGLPLLLGVVTFLILRANRKAHEFTSDATSEMTKMSWPTAQETRLGTIVVIITVIVAGTILGFLDMGFVAIIRSVIGA